MPFRKYPECCKICAIRKSVMNKTPFLIWLGIAAAAGTAIGMISERKNPAKGGLLGATAGLVAGSVAAAAYEYISVRNAYPLYSEVSEVYDET